MKDILFIDPGHAFGIENRKSPFILNNFHIIDMYDFETTDLSPFKAIVVHDFVDQIHMYNHRHLIEQFLNDGKIVIWGGHLEFEWLPGCPIFTPKDIQAFSDYNISIVQENPIFEGVNPDEMTFNKGVAGFFARGSHTPVPVGAEILLTLPGDAAITYIDRQTTRGTILAHAGRDLFAQRMQNKSTDLISEQLLQWVHDEAKRLKERMNNA